MVGTSRGNSLTGYLRMNSSHRQTWRRQFILATAASLLIAAALVTYPAAADASGTTTYTATQTIPVPPASSYAGSGGGDGWAVAMSATQVFNVFHHSPQLTVACHLQSDASPCWSPTTIVDPSGHQFGTSGHPGLYLDQASGKLFVYATRDDSTPGVVCVDTSLSGGATYCGFTALGASGDAVGTSSPAISAPALIGTHWYAYNFVPGAPVGGGAGSQNTLLCFDVSSATACASQPYPLPFTASLQGSVWPGGETAAIGSDVIVDSPTSAGDQITCFDATTNAPCAGSWPTTGPGGAGSFGQPFPYLAADGSVVGFCLPNGSDTCFSLGGQPVATPPSLPTAVPASDGWNGPAVVLGPRVYVPIGGLDQVYCYDWSTSTECANFPRSFPGLSYLYTVNPDPARPTCLWVNADGGTAQIQNFDAYTGGQCGQGPIRVLASSFVVPSPLCMPASYTSLTVDQPAPGTYTSGTVDFRDGDGNAIPGLPTVPLDGSGSASLTGLSLSTSTGLPQFLITLAGAQSAPGAVTVTLKWTGTSDPSCINTGTTTSSQITCGDVMMISAMGSGEAFDGEQNLDHSPVLSAMLTAIRTKVGSAKSVQPYVINYPADSVNVLLAGLLKPTGSNPIAYLYALNHDNAQLQANMISYLSGADQGVGGVNDALRAVRATCPNAKFVLAGYSQGALVMHNWINYFGPAFSPTPLGKAIVGVGLVADPERTKNSAVVNFSDAIPAGYGVCDLVQSYQSCTFQASQALKDVDPSYLSRTVSICKTDDPVCDTSTLIRDWVVNTAQGRTALQAYTQWVHTQYYQSSTELKTLGNWIGQRILRS